MLYNELMADVTSINFQQRVSQNQKQIQTQKLSQQQLQSIKILSMGTEDLRQEIYNTVAKNPALEIAKDVETEGVNSASERSDFTFSDFSKKFSSAKEASDVFQKALEETPDNRETLSAHLQHQFLSMNHSPSEEKLGIKLIENLDSKGFHILSPYSLIDSKDSFQTPELVEKTIKIIQQLDPVGCCCRDFRESLYVQAQILSHAPKAALFILNGHFDFLSPPQPQKVQKKVNQYLETHTDFLEKEQQNEKKFTLEEIQQAIDYIKTLDPFPARDFSSSQTSYISPDVYVYQSVETGDFTVTANNEVLPVIKISPDFKDLSQERFRVRKSTEESEKRRAEHRFIMTSLKNAQDFMDSLQFRKNTLIAACREIVAAQKDFFLYGPRFLKPLRQKEIAEKIGVHEATVSRMAKEKYLYCAQGLFQIGYFFTNDISQPKTLQKKPSDLTEEKPPETKKSEETVSLSKSAIQYEIKNIIVENQSETKKLSDQKIADLLLEKGIKIARRTVAKYRSQLNLDSSYNR